MPYIALVAVGKLPHINVYGNDYDTVDGTGVRDYIHVMDLASGHLSALAFINKSKGFHIFNLGSGRGSSVLEMIKMFEKVSGKSIPYKVSSRRAGDVSISYTNPDKARVELGWTSALTLEDMCVSAWNFQRNYI
jgi:UDP-glucose 4-epimerase